LPDGIGRGFLSAELDEDSKIMPITLGESAPDFAMTLEDGGTIRLSDLQGRPVMINFWATWCPPCRAEMPGIVDAAAMDEELIVLAVNVLEENDLVRAFAEEFEMAMPVVLDVNGELRDHYLVRGMPTSVFINRDGEVESVWVGLLDEDRLEQQLSQIR
jgi:cytochrome c biogenesis protein CcmG, thiol:disulfide interchange protein DsbE